MSTHKGQSSRQPEYRRLYQQGYRDIKRANGLCISIGCNEDTNGFYRCKACRIKQALNMQRYRKIKNVSNSTDTKRNISVE